MIQNAPTRKAGAGRAINEDNEEEVPKNQLWRWGFRLNAYEPFEPTELWENLDRYCKEFYFQLEKGEETGYMHWQGCFSLYEKERLAQAKDIVGFEQVKLLPIKNWHAAKNYVMKNRTRVDGPWTKDSVFIKTITTLYPWQRALEILLEDEPDDRTITWIWNEKGNIGKSAFCKYMAVNHKATILTNGKTSDIAYLIPDNPKVVIFDLPRSSEDGYQNNNKFNYTAIEKIKDGMLMSSKYKSKMKMFNPPHVIVFANWPPDTTALSEDRWDIVNLIDLPEGITKS